MKFNRVSSFCIADTGAFVDVCGQRARQPVPAMPVPHASSSAVRREPDAPTTKMFSNIHKNRARFSVEAVSAAFAKIRTTKVG